jgi:hypothetical protein
MKKVALAVVAICSLMFGVSVTAVAAPCGSGALSQILNTTCTVGNLSFTFGSFNGFRDYTDLNNNYVRTALDPSTIQFESVSTGNAQGIMLLPGWTDAPSANQWFYSGHDANFTYSVTGLNGALIYGESDLIKGTIGNATDTGDFASFDQQNYAISSGCCPFYVYGNVSYTKNLGYYNQPYLEFHFSDYSLGPQSGSDPFNPGQHSTYDAAFTTQTASVDSETLLFFTQPTPEPGTILLSGTALAGVAGILRRKLKS